MYCQKCGNQLGEGAKFCDKCGQGTDVLMVPEHLPASGGLRFATMLLDQVGGFIFSFVLSFIIAAIVRPASEHGAGMLGGMIGILSYFIYYIMFEALWQRTPGKWITGTKVVREDGTQPSFAQIVGRAFCRVIPFEALSFLMAPNPIGWHDRFSRTLVVPASYTEQDVMNIPVGEIKKKKSRAGIVVICVALGIIVIGILSTILLASLGNARERAQHDRGYRVPQSSLYTRE